jgi:methyltransferase family protein
LPRLLPAQARAIELGVSEGEFSVELLRSSNIAHLTCIDAWAENRGHDHKQFERTVARLDPFKGRVTVMRATFAAALAFFEDNTLDLVYVDGYAHEGESGAIAQWYPKVKPGGIFAGHDYHQQWPLVLEAVARLAAEHKLTIHVIPAEKGIYKFPSWYVVKC